MNKERRKKINLQAIKLAEIAESLKNLLDEEQEYFDNMPENLQGSERGETAEEAIGILEEAVESIEDIVSSLEEIC